MSKLLVSPSPHIHSSVSTTTLMRDVVIALAPASVVSVLFYGWYCLLLGAVTVVCCVLTEWAIAKYLLKTPVTPCLWAPVVTGLLLALSLPPATPLWIAAIGSIFAIGVAKMTFGGLGQNIFNPAIAARVFLLISFPVQMTDWTIPSSFMGSLDAFSGATLLGILNEHGASAVNASLANSFFYNVGGSAGEISALALIIGGIYLIARRVIKITIPAVILITSFVFGGICFLVDPSHFMNPFVHLLTGGMLLGAFFMATDYVTSPMSFWGSVVYAIGIGLLTMIIRLFGAYPEGMSFAILIMNAVVPLLDKVFHSKKFGRA